MPKARKEQKRFLVEGMRLVGDALAAGWGPSSLLYDAANLKRTEIGKELLYAISEPRLLDDYRGAIQEASERAIAAASSTQHSQGVVASFPIKEWAVTTTGNGAPLVLVCDDVQDPGNLGTTLRAAEAAGVWAVLLTRDCVDLYNPKVVRAGMGSHFRLPTFPELTWAQVSEMLRTIGVASERLFATEAEVAQSYDKVDWNESSALIISNEAHGLSDGAREAAQARLISIPMLGDTESLNAAMAATVVLFEAARQRRG
ncbi:MAG: RNA methyltransferase [Chloroflexia bacterium]